MRLKKTSARPEDQMLRRIMNTKTREDGLYATAREHGLNAAQREVRVRRRLLRHTDLWLEKSRVRSWWDEDFGTWRIMDGYDRVLEFQTDSPEETLDLIERWLDHIDEWVDSHFE